MTKCCLSFANSKKFRAEKTSVCILKKSAIKMGIFNRNNTLTLIFLSKTMLFLIIITFCPHLTSSEQAANDVILVRDHKGQLHSTPLHIYPGSDVSLEELEQKVRVLINAGDGDWSHSLDMNLADFDWNDGILESKHGLLAFELEKVKEKALRKGRKKNEGKILLQWKGEAAPMEVPFNVFLWNSSDKLVISDIDGTITKMDLADVLFPNIDWAQNGVRALYNKIAGQGYRLVYLSARPLSMGNLTLNYLNSLNIPPGPVLLSPKELISNLATMAEPTLYKTNFLQGIRKFFPAEHRPFQAGLGNALTDKRAYEQVHIPYIFIVNSLGEVAVHIGEDGRRRRGRDGDAGSGIAGKLDYGKLAQHVQLFFPKLT